MTSLRRCIVVLLALAPAASGQVVSYGSPTPPGVSITLDSLGQLPIVGNPNFVLRLQGHPNNLGGGLLMGVAPAVIPVGVATILVDLAGILIVDLPPGLTVAQVPIPAFPGLAGYSGFAQMGVFDPNILGGFALTNGLQVTVMPDRTPTRAYIPGQNFAFGPGFMCSLDLSVQPPAFRATGTVSFSGNIVDDFPNKIAVAEFAGMAYALGNSTTNQFIRAFNVATDPSGVVGWQPVGDIPIFGDVSTIVGARDMEASSGGQYLFAASGGNNVALQVFDVSSAPFSLPSSAVQTISFPGGGSGAVGLELSPLEDRLAVVVGSDQFSTITIYNIAPGQPQPLTPSSFLTLGAFPGNYVPSDLHFSPDGRLLFVTGSNGAFNVIDTLTPVPAILIANGTFPAGGQNLWCHGSAVAVMNGAPVGIVASEGAPASYRLIDLNVASPSFGAIIATFTTNTTGSQNISNHRMHARGSIVVAIDGTGALSDCEWVDVIDLNQPVTGGFASWRVRMPTHATLVALPGSAIPRDFDMF